MELQVNSLPNLAIGYVKNASGHILAGRYIRVPSELLGHFEDTSGALILLGPRRARLACLLTCQCLPACHSLLSARTLLLSSPLQYQYM